MFIASLQEDKSKLQEECDALRQEIFNLYQDNLQINKKSSHKQKFKPLSPKEKQIVDIINKYKITNYIDLNKKTKIPIASLRTYCNKIKNKRGENPLLQA